MEENFEAAVKEAERLWRKHTNAEWRPYSGHDCCEIRIAVQNHGANLRPCIFERLCFEVEYGIVQLIVDHKRDWGERFGSPVYICMNSGQAHACGKMCMKSEFENKMLNCPITGYTVGVPLMNCFLYNQEGYRDKTWRYGSATSAMLRVVNSASQTKNEEDYNTDDFGSDAKLLSRTVLVEPKKRVFECFRNLISIYFSNERSVKENLSAMQELEKLKSHAEHYIANCNVHRKRISLSEIFQIRTTMHDKSLSKTTCFFDANDRKLLSIELATKCIALWATIATFAPQFEINENIRTLSEMVAFVLIFFELVANGVKTTCGQVILKKNPLFEHNYPNDWIKEKMFGSKSAKSSRESAIRRVRKIILHALRYIVEVKRVPPVFLKLDGNGYTNFAHSHTSPQRNLTTS